MYIDEKDGQSNMMWLSLVLSHGSHAHYLYRYVIWCRIDQKTCYKCIITAGMIPIGKLMIEMTHTRSQQSTHTHLVLLMYSKSYFSLSLSMPCLASSLSSFPVPLNGNHQWLNVKGKEMH